MSVQSTLYSEWSHNPNLLNSLYVIDQLINISEEEPLWETDLISLNLLRRDILKFEKRTNTSNRDSYDEYELMEQQFNGDKSAEIKLIATQLGKAWAMARKYQNLGLPLNDLISEGFIGLLTAIPKLDPRGFRAYTYTKHYIRSYIRNALMKYGKQVPCPSNVNNAIKKIKSTIEKEEMLKGWPIFYDEVDVSLDIMNSTTIEDIMDFDYKEISLDKMIDDVEITHLRDELVSSCIHKDIDVSETMMDEEMYYDSLQKEVIISLNMLHEHERNVLKMYFGINQEEMTLRQIGEIMELSPERVRQIKEKGIRRLRGLKSKNLQIFLNH